MHSEEYKQDKLEDTYSDISNDNKIVEKIHEFNVNKIGRASCRERV